MMSLETGCWARRGPAGWRPSRGAGCGGHGAEHGPSPLPPLTAPARGVINRGGKRQPISNSIKSPLVRCELITLIYLEVGFHLQDISAVISTFTTGAGWSLGEEPLHAWSGPAPSAARPLAGHPHPRSPRGSCAPPAQGSPSPSAL